MNQPRQGIRTRHANRWVHAAAALTLAAIATVTETANAAGPRLGLFVDPTWKTSSASVAVDSAGGTHVAFYYYEPKIDQRPTHAVYAYCASQCDQDQSWHSVGFGDLVREVELELTPSGKPRLLITTDSTVYTGGKDYAYAACDTDCTQPNGWTFVTIASGKTPAIGLDNDDELAQHAFELDSQGRPRFVYRDENYAVSPAHSGLFYVACDARCDDPSQWRDALITTTTAYGVERVYHPALAFTADGRPRVVSAEFFPIGSGEARLVYIACEAGCDDSAHWQKVELLPRGGGSEPSADVEIDQNGNPRIAFYQEAMLGGQGKRLFYLACNGSCLQATSWTAVDLGLGTFNGQEPDLELDAQGRPRIAYADWDKGGIGIASCDGNCEAPAGWRHTRLEDRDVLYRAWPVAYPPHCDGGLWNSHTPSLVLPANGTPLVAFDATYYAHCLYDDNPNDNIPPVSKMHLITRAVRLISVDSPSTPPTGVPGAPTNYHASTSGNTVHMSWGLPATGAAPTAYTILARLSPGGPVVASLHVGTATSFSVAAPNGTYIVSVQASNAHGAGPESSPVTITVGYTVAPPAQPTLSVAASGSTVTFSWAVPRNGGLPDVHTLEAGATAGFTAPIVAIPLPGRTDVSFAGVPAGTYFARIFAQNGAGRSPSSNEVRFTVAGATSPAPPSLNAPVVTGHTVILRWTPGEGGAPSGYTLIASLAPGGAPLVTVPLGGASASFANVPSGMYYLRLTATNAVGTSQPSNEVVLVVP